ncbi:DDE-type integrase/transposase/recombinase [Streptomyces sp. A7024]|uniref:DDE-type integrase/transposase/recombinase n=1 Tax=Streptomyces coryli TaxID=1128680 RepID=A0A6G4TVN5_9ACTN|nr:DDE-type integrase/transposase/recombinase [Streptomyces coryli]
MRVGDQVRFEDRVHSVVGLEGTLVRLADADGAVIVLQLPHLQMSEGFRILGHAERLSLPQPSRLAGATAEAVRAAEWWEEHLHEVLTGMIPSAEAGARPRHEYDPAVHTLAARERAKAAELAALGVPGCSERTLRRKRKRYEEHGLAGLLDRRGDGGVPLTARCDQRVVAALRQALAEAVDESSKTVEFFRWRTQRILAAEHGEGVVAMPSRATFYRLFAKVDAGGHATGSAATRRSLANRPEDPFSGVTADRPGELVQIDSTPFDVAVLLDAGVPGRVALTGMVDLATRTVLAAVLRPTTKSVDASLLLARAVTPEPMRPGWSQALSMARSVLPHRPLTDIDQRLEHAAARPVIVPELIVCDRGAVFLSRNFRASCRTLGISVQPAHPGTPTDKPHIERTLESVSTMFCQFVAGHLGRSAEMRGSDIEGGPLWSLLQMQELLDEWLVARWQNHRHDGLRDPAAPGRAFTPNEKYAALVAAAGYVPVALSGDDYVELLPACWRTIGAGGIKVNHRRYDCAELNPLRRQDSGDRVHRGLWEIHHDPYDVSRIWVRHPQDGWITVPWRHLSTVPGPFGELAWDHARRELPDGSEQERAAAVAALLDRAHRGPPGPGSKRRDRVAARTRAAAREAIPAPEPEHDHDAGESEAAPEQESAEVIPLGLFDPLEDPWRRR